MKYLLTVTCLACAVTFARAEEKAPAAAHKAADAPTGNGSANFSGKVVETTNATSYTYILVDTGNKKLWAAVPSVKVKPGDSVTIAGAFEMQGYRSPTLNRNFESVYFTDKILVNGAKPEDPNQLPTGHPTVADPAAKRPKVDLTGITRAEGGQTVADIYANKSKLKGKSVKVRGKVVRYNGKILGKNWLHVKDGTGSKGTDDLMVTSDTKAQVGDTVLVSGKVTLDKDFGSGYKYDVILDNAKVKVE